MNRAISKIQKKLLRIWKIQNPTRFYIIVVLLISATAIGSVIYIVNPELPQQEKPSPPDFVREPTIKDVQPIIGPQDQQSDQLEDWWYAAVLQGDNGITYGFKLLFDSVPRIRLTFDDLSKVMLEHTNIECLHFELNKTEKGALIRCDLQDGYAQTVITPPDNHYISLSKDDIKLELDFESRGLPYWYTNGFMILEGYEDLLRVSGTLIEGGEEIQLHGYGAFEKALYDMTKFEDVAHIIWTYIHFDQGYVFIFETQSKGGYTIREGIISLDGGYIYINDPNRIILEQEVESQTDSGKLVKEDYITIHTDYGELKLHGTFLATLGLPVLVHDYNGNFTHNDGTVIELSNGIGMGCFCLH